jgi:H+/Cl- antiporter ClcA
MWLFLGTGITSLILMGITTWASHHVTETSWWLFVRRFTGYFSHQNYWVLMLVALVLFSLFVFSLWLMYGDAPAEPLNSAKELEES